MFWLDIFSRVDTDIAWGIVAPALVAAVFFGVAVYVFEATNRDGGL